MEFVNLEESLPLLNHTVDTTAIKPQTFHSDNKKKGFSLPMNKFKDNYAHDSKNEELISDPFVGKSNTNSYETFKKRLSFDNEKVAYGWKNVSAYENIKVNTQYSIWKKNILKENEDSATGKRILENAYGVAFFGELLAIMGSSGAGKTTLLNSLNFQSSNTTVSITGFRYLNGRLLRNRNSISRVSAYVEQETLFFGNLTVKEHLIFQALVRMNHSVPYNEKLSRVDAVINELGLEMCKNTVIGYPGRTKGISGGERKRLSFASEILTNPAIMFCDEPTSGLDSFIAFNVINVLKSLAMKGKSIICTIHQPSSDIFALFDKILLLAEGRTAFLGTPEEAISFFSELGAVPLCNYNPADYYIHLLAIVPHQEENCRKTIKFICDQFDESKYGLNVLHAIESENKIQAKDMGVERIQKDFCLDNFKHPKYKASWYFQFKALFWRSWLNITKEALVVKVRLFQTLVLSLAVGLIYQKQKLNADGVININGVLFTFLTNMTFQNLFAVISVFCDELPIFLKEHSNKMYRVDTYFLSKTLAEIPIFIVIPTIFTGITYFWINLNPTATHFGFTLLILVLVTNVATSFGYLISCLSKNGLMALSIGPPIIIPFLLFGGFLLNIGAIPSYFKWFTYLSWFKYGNEALLINQWSDINSIECTTYNFTCPKNGAVVLEIFHFEQSNFLFDILALLVLTIVFRILAYVVLLLKTLRYHHH